MRDVVKKISKIGLPMAAAGIWLLSAGLLWAQGEGLVSEAVDEHAVHGESFDKNGINGVSDGAGSADHGVYGTTNSTSSTDAGVRGTNTGGGAGVYGSQSSSNTSAFGVRGYSLWKHGVYGESASTDSGIYGGWFSGPAGVYGQANHQVGNGVVGMCPDDGVIGCWGMEAESGNSTGIKADTERTDDNYGLVTNSNVYIGGSCTGCTIALVVQSGSGPELRAGDLVTVAGVGEPLPNGLEPTVVVTRAGLEGVFGVVKNTLEIEMISKPRVTFVKVEIPDPEGGPADVIWEQRVQDRQVAVHNGVERPAQPGDYLVVIVQGMAQVKADASVTPIAPGARLASLGHTTLPASSLAAADAELPIVGTALEPLFQGEGLVWTWVNPG